MKHKFLLFLLFQYFLFCVFQNLECKEKLKILIVLEMFPCAIQTFVLNQITGLIDKGHDVWIFARKKWEVELPLSDETKKYNLLKKTYYDVIPNNLDSFDIVYCQFAHISHDFAKLKKTGKRPWKLVVAFRGYDASASLRQNPHIYDDLFKVGDLFLPVCNYFKNILIGAGCDSRKVEVHHSAINCEKFAFQIRSKDSMIHIVTIARLVKEKGVEIALEAIFSLMKKNKNIKYTIIGDGPLRKILDNKILDSGYADRIHILGYISHDEVCKILLAAHICVLVPVTRTHNILEGIPNALMEAMALGIPVISSYHSGIPELIEDGKPGFLVPEYDIKALADKLQYLINHYELRLIFSLAGRSYIEREHNIAINNNCLEKKFYKLIWGNHE